MSSHFLCAALMFSARMLFAGPPLPNINTNNIINVTNTPYGAKGDGVTTNTTAIQNAINAATLGGLTNGMRGGIVEIPPGIFLSGPLKMSNSVNLRIDAGATLKMLPYGQYPTNPSPPDFIAANNLNNIAISGSGVIEGQGAPWWAAFDASGINRPKAMFAPSNCRTVLVENVTLQSPPNTHISLRNLCREVTIRGITINTTSDVVSVNTDGIDVNATNCVIQDCWISCGDDHVAMGGGSSSVLITNCVFRDGHGVSIGSHTDGGLNGLFVKDCTMTIGSGLSSGIRMKSGRDRGGFVRNLTYFNMALTNVQNPIFISSYYPDSTIPTNPTTDTGSAITPTTPIWRDITISNVNALASSGRNAGRIYGLPEMLITNLTLSKVTVKADKSFDMYHVRNARFIDSQINVPANINTFNLYNVDLTLTNSVFNTNLVKIGGWSSALVTNKLALFNTRVLTTDTNVLPRTASITLANALLAVTNNWIMSPLLVVNLTLGASNATVAVTSNLTLNGTINVSAGAGFTNGNYMIFTYGNTLTWGTPALGSTPPGYNYTFDTNTVGQVKLLVTIPPPVAPANLRAIGTNLLINLDWPAVTNAVSYNLKRSTTNDGNHPTVVSGLTATNYSDTDVTNAVTYYYVVSAVNSGGESADSIQASATAQPSLAPASVALKGSGDQLQLSWPEDHLGWRLEIQTNDLLNGLGTNWFIVQGSENTIRFLIPVDLANGTVFCRLVYP